MGVVRGRKSVSYPEDEDSSADETPSSSSETESDSSSEASVYAVSPPKRKRRGPKTIIYNDYVTIKSNIGKRKARRYMNRSVLEYLPKTDGDNSNHVMEYYKGPFERLMEICDNPMDHINTFIDTMEKKTDIEETILQRKNNDKPYFDISHKIRRAMKLRKNFPCDHYKDVEREVIGFFVKNPCEVFVSLPPNSFGRLFLHAVSAYHDLRSTNIAGNCKTKVEIRNVKENWIPVECILCEYILLKDL